MNEDDKKAMKAAWQQWHSDIDPDLVPNVNFSFEVGFEAGVSHARGASDAVIAGLRRENEVLRDLLLEYSIHVLEAVSDDDDDDWMIAMAMCAKIKAALAPYDANGYFLI